MNDQILNALKRSLLMEESNYGMTAHAHDYKNAIALFEKESKHHNELIESLKELIEILEDYSESPQDDEELIRAKLAVDNAMNGKSGYVFEKMD